jgi:hypothetical protein
VTFKTVLPLGLVAVLAVVAVGAAVLGVRQEPRQLFFTLPSATSGSASAREQLTMAATKTLGESSFKMVFQPGLAYRYQAPDVYAVDDHSLVPEARGGTGLVEVQVGTQLYSRLWSKGRSWLSNPVRDGGLSRVVSSYLSNLTDARDVEQSRQRFSAVVVTLGYRMAPAGVPISAEVWVSRGRIVRERITISGTVECSLLSSWCPKAGHLTSESTTIRYATFGTAPIQVPPSREVMQAEPCGGSFVPPGHCGL